MRQSVLTRSFAASAGVLVIAVSLAAALWTSWPDGGRGTVGSPTTAADARPSIVVLPFDDMTASKEQEYLAGGFTEDMTTELARIPGMFVVSRNAASSFKGKEMKPTEIATALRVRYLLEGSIRRVGNEVRINAQLIDGSTDGHLWAERYDGQWDARPSRSQACRSRHPSEG